MNAAIVVSVVALAWSLPGHGQSDLVTAPVAPMVEPKDVIDSIDHHPLLVEATEMVAAARGEALKLRAPYDPVIAAKASSDPMGDYRQRALDVVAEQAVPVWGNPRVFGGYTRGQDFASYDGKRVTGPLGAITGGVRLDLARSFFADDDRAGLVVGELIIVEAEAALEANRLTLLDDALAAYWEWVLAHHLVVVEERLVHLAEDRMRLIETQISLGNTAEIVRIDNQRLVMSRRTKREEARLKAQQATQKLSFFLRSDDGTPALADTARVPAWGWCDTDDAIVVTTPSVDNRPELKVFDAMARRFDAILDANRADLLPDVELALQVRKDLGEFQGRDYVGGETRALTSVEVKLPVLRSKARGTLAATSAKRRAVTAKRNATSEKLTIEAMNWANGVRVHLDRLTTSRFAVIAALKLEEAERKRFAAGYSNLIDVNLREEASARELAQFWSTAADVERAHASMTLLTGAIPDGTLLASTSLSGKLHAPELDSVSLEISQ